MSTAFHLIWWVLPPGVGMREGARFRCWLRLLRRVFLLHLAMLSTASGEQWLKCVSQIAHQMKTIGNLHGLGSRFARGCCVICPTVAASAPQFPDVGVTTLQRLHWSDLVTNRYSFFAQDRLKWFRIGGPSSHSTRPRP